jgi:hypothetical protein
MVVAAEVGGWGPVAVDELLAELVAAAIHWLLLRVSQPKAALAPLAANAASLAMGTGRGQWMGRRCCSMGRRRVHEKGEGSTMDHNLSVFSLMIVGAAIVLGGCVTPAANATPAQVAPVENRTSGPSMSRNADNWEKVSYTAWLHRNSAICPGVTPTALPLNCKAGPGSDVVLEMLYTFESFQLESRHWSRLLIQMRPDLLSAGRSVALPGEGVRAIFARTVPPDNSDVIGALRGTLKILSVDDRSATVWLEVEDDDLEWRYRGKVRFSTEGEPAPTSLPNDAAAPK